MSKKLTILILICSFFIWVVGAIFPDEALYYYHSISNGRIVNEQIRTHGDFAITEKRGEFVFLIRNLGHQKEQIVVLGKADWKFDYISAKEDNSVVELVSLSGDCVVYKKNRISKSIPDYTYDFPELDVFLLVYGASRHLERDIVQFCKSLGFRGG